MWFLKKKTDSNKVAIKSFNGRLLQYVSQRIDNGEGVRDQIVGKGGRVAVHDGDVKITIGTESIFICPLNEARCNLLMSGNGATVEGQNKVSGKFEKFIVYYSKN